MQAELTLAQGEVQVVAALGAGHTDVLVVVAVLIADGGDVGGDLEGQVGHDLTGGGLGQGVGVVGGLDVHQDAQGLGQGAHVDLPAHAGELAVLAVAHGAQQHGQHLIAGHVAVGVEVAVVALDVARVNGEAHVGGEPVGRLHVVEVGGQGGVQRHLGVIHVVGDQAVQDGDGLAAHDLVLRQELAVVAAEHAHAGQDVNRFLELGQNGIHVGIVRLGILGVGGDHQGEGHNHRQNQSEELLQVSHWICFLLIIFCSKFDTLRSRLRG